MRRRQPNSGSPDIRVPKVTVGERSSSKKHSKSELVNKYIKYFAQFINSIDFDKL